MEEKKEIKTECCHCVTVEEKKEIKTDWYGVCSYLGLFIFFVIFSYVWWPLWMDVWNSEPIILGRCAVVVCIGLIWMYIPSLLVILVAMIDTVIKNRRSRSIAYLELELEVDTRQRRTREYGIDPLLVMPIMIVVGLYGIRDALRILSPNYEYHEKISKYHNDSLLFSLCFLTSSVVVHLLFSGGLTIVRRIVRRMCFPVSENIFEKLEKVYRVLPQLYLVLNMKIFLGLYKYAAWPIHMKFVIFAAYFFSFFALLVVAVLTERIDRAKLVGSPGWKNDRSKLVASTGWKELLQSPDKKNAGGKLVESTNWNNADNFV